MLSVISDPNVQAVLVDGAKRNTSVIIDCRESVRTRSGKFKGNVMR